MQLIREAIDECSFIDLGFSGSQHTWQRHFPNGYLIWERLDRFLANNDWLIKFARSKVHHLHCSTSDHIPMWIVPDGIEFARPSKPFRFEEMWLSDKGCDETIEAVWTNTNHVGPRIRVVNKVEKCGQALTSWSRKCFGSVRKDLEKARKKLIQAEKDAMISGVNHRVLEYRSKVNELIDKEIKMWFQRSRSLRLFMEREIQNIFTVKLLRGLEGIKLRVLKILLGNGLLILMMLLTALSTITSPFLQLLVLVNLKRPSVQFQT